MCDFCTKDGFDNFDKRMEYVKNTISRYGPDLISLQELRTSSQVETLLKSTPQYQAIYAKFWWGSYPDALVAYNIHRFEKVDEGYFWLGPGENFSLGWEMSLPRLTIWVRLRDKISNQQFLFAGSHFDNRVENLNNSGTKVRTKLKEANLPIIFAADTNLPRKYQGYVKMIGNFFVNSFEKVTEHTINANEQYQAIDLCYPKKGKKFPECSVEHVLLSKDHNWNVSRWELDVFRYGPNSRFASDHRAVFVELSLD